METKDPPAALQEGVKCRSGLVAGERGLDGLGVQGVRTEHQRVVSPRAKSSGEGVSIIPGEQMSLVTKVFDRGPRVRVSVVSHLRLVLHQSDARHEMHNTPSLRELSSVAVPIGTLPPSGK